ncbi:MAG: DUF2953 domain-containing protein [Lachnospiraceae bacterium]
MAALIAMVLLTVLKAVLFLLLVVILVIMLVLCLVLFTPLKYNIYAEKYNTTRAEGRFSWLLGIVKVSFLYDNGEGSYKLKVFGADYKKLAGFFAGFSRKKKKKEYNLEAMEDPVQNRDKNGKDNYEEKKKVKNFPQEEEKPLLNKFKTSFKENKTHKDEGKAPQEEKAGMDKKDKETAWNSKNSGTGKDKRAGSSIISNIRIFWKKIKSLPEEIKNIFNKIKKNIKTFKKKASNIQNTVHGMKGRFNRVKEFILSEVTKNMLDITKDKIFYLLKKIKPRKIKSDIVFGTGDPCQTGYITGLCAVYMAVSGTFFNITPDFENKILKGRISVSGHIRASSLAFAVLRVIISNEWKSFYKEAVKIKEEF